MCLVIWVRFIICYNLVTSTGNIMWWYITYILVNTGIYIAYINIQVQFKVQETCPCNIYIDVIKSQIFISLYLSYILKPWFPSGVWHDANGSVYSYTICISNNPYKVHSWLENHWGLYRYFICWMKLKMQSVSA